MLLVCSHCFAPLALDQRYCVDCGVRARALCESGPWGPEFGRESPKAGTPPAGGRLAWPSAWLPSPRVAAVAVMGMLAFGAELGAAVGANPALEATSRVIINRAAGQPGQSTAAAPVAAAQTETIFTAGGSPGAGGAPAVAAAPTVAPAPTTTSAPTAAMPTGSGTNAYGLPEIKHVFVIMLGNAGFSQTFNSQDAYLGKTLLTQGKLMQFYYGVTGGELANEVALFSGQGPTDQTATNCPTYSPFTMTGSGTHDQALGSGCVYPKHVATLGSQLVAAHLTWKGYIQGEADGLPGHPQACVHPALGQPDPNQILSPTGTYVTWRNPFVYFGSITQSPGCGKQDADYSQLSSDLTTESTTPNLSVIVPNPCDDASADPCRAGGVGGTAPADLFLKTTIAEIEGSPAYRAGGLIIVTGDQAPQSGTNADSSACCATPRYPNLSSPPPTPPSSGASTSTTSTSTTTDPSSSSTTSAAAPSIATPIGTVTAPTLSVPAPVAGTTGTTTPAADTTTPSSSTTTTSSAPPNLGTGGQTTATGGGGQIGMVLISPWVKKATDDPIDYYNHYSLLKSLEEIFGIKQRLGYAGAPGLTAFNAATFDGPGPATQPAAG